jgi:hypothetical protein
MRRRVDHRLRDRVAASDAITDAVGWPGNGASTSCASAALDFRFHRSGKLSGIVLLSARCHRDQHRTIKLLATVDAAIVLA